MTKWMVWESDDSPDTAQRVVMDLAHQAAEAFVEGLPGSHFDDGNVEVTVRGEDGTETDFTVEVETATTYNAVRGAVRKPPKSGGKDGGG